MVDQTTIHSEATGWTQDRRTLLLHPGAQVLERGRAIGKATAEPLVGRLAESGGQALDGEQATDRAQRYVRERRAA